MKAVKTVNVHEAKTNLSRLLAEVEKGNEVVVARNGKPVAKIVPFSDAKKPRVFGKGRGRVWISEDFDAPLPDELLDLFYK
jgi:prevent-host-death family protein